MRTAVAETSVQAYRQHKGAGKASEQRSRIVSYIKSRGGDWTISELSRELGLEKSTVSARLNEGLYETLELVACAKRKDRYSGIMARPVAIADDQGRLFQ